MLEKKHQSLTLYQVRDFFLRVCFFKYKPRVFLFRIFDFLKKIDDKLNEKRDIVRICENHPVNKLEGLGEIYDHIQKSTTHCIHLIQDNLWTLRIVFFFAPVVSP